eukprot:1688016-Prymnesium_polylepis.1
MRARSADLRQGLRERMPPPAVGAPAHLRLRDQTQEVVVAGNRPKGLGDDDVGAARRGERHWLGGRVRAAHVDDVRVGRAHVVIKEDLQQRRVVLEEQRLAARRRAAMLRPPRVVVTQTERRPARRLMKGGAQVVTRSLDRRQELNTGPPRIERGRAVEVVALGGWLLDCAEHEPQLGPVPAILGNTPRRPP